MKVNEVLSIGDKVRRRCSHRNGRPWMEGTVVYIHPDKYYHVVEFHFAGGGSFRESFPFCYKFVPEFI